MSSSARTKSDCGIVSPSGAAVGFAACSIPSYDRALNALRTSMDSWSGIGHVTSGMARQGFDLRLTRYDERGWRAPFYVTRGTRADTDN
jgi:hypothetical protein